MLLHSRVWKRCGERWYSLQKPTSPSRRFNSRVVTPEGVWVFWSCGGRDEIARVRDLSGSGLFVEIANPIPVGATANLEFLVQEGHIRAEAVVRHARPGEGVGLKFTAMAEKDRPRLEALLKRLRLQ